MNDLTRIIAALVFVIIWYAMTLIGRALMKPYEKLKLVIRWIRTVSMIQ